MGSIPGSLERPMSHKRQRRLLTLAPSVLP
jgi:hypothetical protein